MEVVVTTGAIRHAEPRSKRHRQQIKIPFFLRDECPSYHPTNSAKVLLKGNVSTQLYKTFYSTITIQV